MKNPIFSIFIANKFNRKKRHEIAFIKILNIAMKKNSDIIKIVRIWRIVKKSG
jgi:hypothetical protein